jgi:hypothetical protein
MLYFSEFYNKKLYEAEPLNYAAWRQPKNYRNVIAALETAINTHPTFTKQYKEITKNAKFDLVFPKLGKNALSYNLVKHFATKGGVQYCRTMAITATVKINFYSGGSLDKNAGLDLRFTFFLLTTDNKKYEVSGGANNNFKSYGSFDENQLGQPSTWKTLVDKAAKDMDNAANQLKSVNDILKGSFKTNLQIKF